MKTQHLIEAGDTLLVTSYEAIAALNHSHNHLDCSHLWWWWPIIGAPVLLVLIVFFLVKYSNVKLLLFKRLGWLALGVWISGFLLYCIGFNHEGSNNPLTLALRASLSSVEMFTSHSDLLEVQHWCHQSTLYMIVFAITHFMAVVVSAAFIVRLIGLRFVSRFKLKLKRNKLRIYKWLRSKSWLRSIRWINKLSWLAEERHSLFNEDWYIFWGVNPNSILMAGSIESKRKCCKLFVNLPSENKTHAHAHSSHFSLSQLFHLSDDEVKNCVGAIEDMGALLVYAHHPFVKNSFKDLGDDQVRVFRDLGIPYCDKLINDILRNEQNKVEHFFLSEDMDANIAAIVALKSVYGKIEKRERDKKELQSKAENNAQPKAENELQPKVENNAQPKAKREPSMKCYCHARRNSVNTALLQCPGLNDQIYLIDSSSLAVMNLINKPDSDPVNYVEVNNDECIAESPFTAMVIGFGEAGRDAFRFLYEFASLPCNELGDENPKTIYVVDEKLKSLKFNFLKSAPALDVAEKAGWWIDSSTHSELFWQSIREKINALNYIVITVGSDEEAMNLAVELFECAYRYRADMCHFRIYVRLRANELTKELERLYGNYIVPFGDDKSTFSYANISMNEVEEGAKKFYYAYEKIRMQEQGVNLDFSDKKVEREVKALWTERRIKLNAANDDVIKQRTQQIELRYKEAQDISNYRHIATKRYLAGWNKAEKEKLTDISRTNQGTAPSKELTAVQKTSLANCEHLRWNAKMELLSFVYGTPVNSAGGRCSKDIQRRIHRCIVGCQALRHGEDADNVNFDNIVIDVTFRPEFNPKK